MVFGVERGWEKVLRGMIINKKEKLNESILDFPFVSRVPGFFSEQPFLRESTLGGRKLVFR